MMMYDNFRGFIPDWADLGEALRFSRSTPFLPDEVCGRIELTLIKNNNDGLVFFRFSCCGILRHISFR
jgi:hypothetical protein